jgi:hypothetical protein
VLRENKELISAINENVMICSININNTKNFVRLAMHSAENLAGHAKMSPLQGGFLF